MDMDEELIVKLRELIKTKGDSITRYDFLIPELKWVIDCIPFDYDDRRFAELRFIEGKKAKDIMEELGWYSTNTFTRHNKKVWNMILQTVKRLLL